MAEIELCGGPCDGRKERLNDFYEMAGELRQRKGWPVVIEIRAHPGERPPDQIAPHGTAEPGGRLVARYCLTGRITADGQQVYEYIPG
jgi:hypothetical protein